MQAFTSWQLSGLQKGIPDVYGKASERRLHDPVNSFYCYERLPFDLVTAMSGGVLSAASSCSHMSE